MKRTKLFSLTIMSVFTLLSLNPTANADRNRHNPYLGYEQICDSANGLQYTSLDLRKCFSAEFRGTGYYGKLKSRSSRLKSAAKRLHRKANSRSSCNWQKDIQLLDEMVCELDTYVDKAVYHSRGCTPICPATVRKVRSLIAKAGYYVDTLESSLRHVEYVEVPSCKARPTVIIEEPVHYNEPIRYNEPAPAYIPNHGAEHHEYRSSRPNDYSRNHRPSFESLAFDIAGLLYHRK